MSGGKDKQKTPLTILSAAFSYFNDKQFRLFVRVSTSWYPYKPRSLSGRLPGCGNHLFQNPLAVITYESKVGAFQFQCHGLGFTGFQLYLLKSTEAWVSGVREATRSLLKSRTLSLPTRLPVFFTSTVNVSTSSAAKLDLSTLRLLYAKVV